MLTTEEIMQRFNISKPTAIQLFRTKGSPAFKVGTGRGHWRVDPVKFEQFLIKKSEDQKG